MWKLVPCSLHCVVALLSLKSLLLTHHSYVNAGQLVWQYHTVMVNELNWDRCVYCCAKLSVFAAKKCENLKKQSNGNCDVKTYQISSIKYIISRPLQTCTYSLTPPSPLPLLWVNHRLTMLSPMMEPSSPLWGENWRGAASALFTLDLHFLRFGTGWVFEAYSELWHSSKAFITRPLWNGKKLNSRWQADNPRCCRSSRTVFRQVKLYFVNIILKATGEDAWNRSQRRKV